jgi:hypothetical protein
MYVLPRRHWCSSRLRSAGVSPAPPTCEPSEATLSLVACTLRMRCVSQDSVSLLLAPLSGAPPPPPPPALSKAICPGSGESTKTNGWAGLGCGVLEAH